MYQMKKTKCSIKIIADERRYGECEISYIYFYIKRNLK